LSQGALEPQTAAWPEQQATRTSEEPGQPGQPPLLLEIHVPNVSFSVKKRDGVFHPINGM